MTKIAPVRVVHDVSKFEITLDASEFIASIDAALTRLRAIQRPESAAEPLPLVVASAAAAAIGCAKPVSRRSFFGLRLW